jgi:hypothetical protein
VRYQQDDVFLTSGQTNQSRIPLPSMVSPVAAHISGIRTSGKHDQLPGSLLSPKLRNKNS